MILPTIDGILPKGPYPQCSRMADRPLLAGYPRYVDGSRFFNSPIYLMLFLEQRKLHYKSTCYMYLRDPMKSWITALTYCNMPLIFTSALVRSGAIATFFAALVITNCYDESREPMTIISRDVSSNLNKSSQTQHTDNTILMLLLCYNLWFAAVSNFNYCPLVGFSHAEKVQIKSTRFRREHFVSFSKIIPLSTKIFYWNLALIHLGFMPLNLLWLNYSKF